MKMKIILLAVILLSTVQVSKSESKKQKPAAVPRTEIEAINQKIAQFYQTENASALVNLYTEQLTFFPEYKPAVFSSKNLKNFYQDWFQAVEVKAYQKKIYKVEVLPGYLLETGNLNSSYTTAGNLPLAYNGKYMVLWQRDSAGKLRIVSETFGSDKYLEADKVPYASVQVPESKILAKNRVSEKLFAEVEEFNAEVIKAVTAGDGEARAKGFTPDGIYMPHFDSILTGMAVIRPYMLKTYKPGSGLFVQHTYNRIYDLGEYVFVNGHFKGGWGNSTGGGRFEGNMSNLMKRNRAGKLVMHRQIGNNDRKDVALNAAIGN